MLRDRPLWPTRQGLYPQTPRWNAVFTFPPRFGPVSASVLPGVGFYVSARPTPKIEKCAPASILRAARLRGRRASCRRASASGLGGSMLALLGVSDGGGAVALAENRIARVDAAVVF